MMKRWLFELIEQATQEGEAYKVAFSLSLAVNVLMVAVVLMKRK